MKLVNEHINEKFSDKTDPIKDLSIGGIDLKQVYQETVGVGIKSWEKFFKQYRGKQITIFDKDKKRNVTFTLKDVKLSTTWGPKVVYLFSEGGREYQPRLDKPMNVHEIN
jgi:hypothetical protein